MSPGSSNGDFLSLHTHFINESTVVTVDSKDYENAYPPSYHLKPVPFPVSTGPRFFFQPPCLELLIFYNKIFSTQGSKDCLPQVKDSHNNGGKEGKGFREILGGSIDQGA